mgnify:CR=1 FL=1
MRKLFVFKQEGNFSKSSLFSARNTTTLRSGYSYNIQFRHLPSIQTAYGPPSGRPVGEKSLVQWGVPSGFSSQRAVQTKCRRGTNPDVNLLHSRWLVPPRSWARRDVHLDHLLLAGESRHWVPAGRHSPHGLSRPGGRRCNLGFPPCPHTSVHPVPSKTPCRCRLRLVGARRGSHPPSGGFSQRTCPCVNTPLAR